VRFQDAFGVADGVEGRRARADGADAEVFEAFGDAADLGKPLEIRLELVRLGRLGVQRGQRILDPVLHHVVAGAHFAAEAVAAGGDGHGVAFVGSGLDEDGHLETGKADGVDHTALVAEVGQGDDDAVDGFAVFLEEIGAALGFSKRFHRAVLRLLGGKHDRLCSGRFNCGDHLFAASFCQVAWEESAIAHYHSIGHCSLRCHVRLLLKITDL